MKTLPVYFPLISQSAGYCVYCLQWDGKTILHLLFFLKYHLAITLLIEWIGSAFNNTNKVVLNGRHSYRCAGTVVVITDKRSESTNVGTVSEIEILTLAEVTIAYGL